MAYIWTFDSIFVLLVCVLCVSSAYGFFGGMWAKHKGKADAFNQSILAAKMYITMAWVLLLIGCSWFSLAGTTTFLVYCFFGGFCFGIGSRIASEYYGKKYPLAYDVNDITSSIARHLANPAE